MVLVAGDFFFNVHQGLLCRHSVPFTDAIEALKADEKNARFIDENIVLEIPDHPKDLSYFLMALYDGV